MKNRSDLCVSPFLKKKMLLGFFLLPERDFQNAIFYIESKLIIQSRKKAFLGKNEEG
jgi:hypothetical protein